MCIRDRFCTTTPEPFVPGVLGVAVPLDAVSRKRFSPTLCRPPLLTKVATCMVPTCTGAVTFGSVMLTTPSGATVTVKACAAIVIAGCKG